MPSALVRCWLPADSTGRYPAEGGKGRDGHDESSCAGREDAAVWADPDRNRCICWRAGSSAQRSHGPMMTYQQFHGGTEIPKCGRGSELKAMGARVQAAEGDPNAANLIAVLTSA